MQPRGSLLRRLASLRSSSIFLVLLTSTGAGDAGSESPVQEALKNAHMHSDRRSTLSIFELPNECHRSGSGGLNGGKRSLARSCLGTKYITCYPKNHQSTIWNPILQYDTPKPSTGNPTWPMPWLDSQH